MEFDLSSTQRMMQQAARTFLGKECPTTRVRSLMASDTALDAQLWQGMAEQGWLGIAIDEAHGGLGLGAIELAVIAEEMGRACLPGPFVSHVWGASTLSAIDCSLREKLLPALCEGTQRATIALLEQSPSWNWQSVKLQAERAGDGWRIGGVKRLVNDAATSDVLLCVVRQQGELALAAIETKSPGVKLTETPAIDATRKLYDVQLDVTVPGDAIIARGAAAEQALAQGAQMGALVASAELVGVMQWILETSVEYVKTRKQFDRVVGSFQAVQQQCVDMLLWLESARSATLYAAWALASGEADAARGVSAAKAYASDAAREVANRGVQVHGGIGFTWEHDMHLYYKRAKSNELLLGDASFHRELVARSLVGAA